jgi:hypothetical protein
MPPLEHDCVVTLPLALMVRHRPAFAPRLEMVRFEVEAMVVEITVEVANVRNVLPARVVEAAKRPLVALRSDEMVVEPLIASAVPVALAKKSGPVSVVEAEVSEVVVALSATSFVMVDDAEKKLVVVELVKLF